MFNLRYLVVGIVLLLPVLTISSAGSDGEKQISISAGSGHTCALTSSGKAYCWGYNDYGALGNNSTVSSKIPVAVSAPKGENAQQFISLDTGFGDTCGLTSTGKAYCWGETDTFKSFINDTHTFSTVPVIVPNTASSLNFSSISLGFDHRCGLTFTGKAYCWGSNINGELGTGDSIDSQIPVAVNLTRTGENLQFSSISVGNGFTCGLTVKGIGYCWGANVFGELGIRHLETSVPETIAAPKGEQSLVFSAISAGGTFTCGLTLIGKAYCWGDNENGELGNHSIVDSTIPVAVAAPKGESPIIFSSISTGDTHSCGLNLKGKAYCWGANEYGALGDNTHADSSLPISVADPTDENSLTFSSISAGDGYTCGLTRTGKAYCWGHNFFEQLGISKSNGSSVPVPVVAIP
jgi:alpha-tubulin suppressor-like RCC1 family protein